MPSHFKNIALMGNFEDSQVLESVRVLAGHLPGKGARVLVDASKSSHELPDTVHRVPADVLTRQANLIIAVGGDGAMLSAARLAAKTGIPMLGINRGRLGFLADVSPRDQLEPLDRLLAADFDSEERMLLHAEIVTDSGTTDCGLALNDVVVKRQDSGRMLEFQSYVDGTYVNTHGGDGFIIATPTGSTAYALSCGGPIVAPNLDAIVLAPICPHTLSDRPIVIPAASITEVKLAQENLDSAEVCCDGEVAGRISGGDRLRVAAAKQRVELIHPRGYDYYEILRSKLHWGRGNRKTSADD
jgi:NAD+ kinase